MNAGDCKKPAWDLLLEDSTEWISMNGWKTKHPNNNLNYSEYLIVFAQYYPYGPEYFIFGGMYKVEKIQHPEIYELAPDTKLGHFPGYQNVSLKHKDMQHIINSDEPSWKQALSNVKGGYVVTDTNNGSLYIGSASGSVDGIWQRWSGYADIGNLTGGNKEFAEIMKNKGEDYLINNFQYSILEIFDTKTKIETIIERENYWKNVLDTKKHGMNHN